MFVRPRARLSLSESSTVTMARRAATRILPDRLQLSLGLFVLFVEDVLNC